MSAVPLEQLLATIRVLWRHPYNGSLYGIPYEMRPNQSPTDIWRRSARRVRAFTPKLGIHDMWEGEEIPDDWIYLNERWPELKPWLAELEARDPGVTPVNAYEWSKIDAPPATQKCTRTACTNQIGEHPAIHRDSKKYYCIPCARRINEACGEDVVTWKAPTT